MKELGKFVTGLVVLGLGVLFLCFCSSTAIHEYIIATLQGL